MFFLSFVSAEAQKILNTTDKNFNWGGKIGCNAVFPIINTLAINGVSMENIQQHYRVGYQATLFARINFDKIFIEPSLMWINTENELRFTLPKSDSESATMGSATNYLENTNRLIEMPVMIGYYLVRENPYALTLSVGPTFKYNYKNTYFTHLTDVAREYESDNTPFGVGIAMGMGISIGKLFLNFNYEFGLNELDTKFKEIGSNVRDDKALHMEKRTNMFSFSLGFML